MSTAFHSTRLVRSRAPESLSSQVAVDMLLVKADGMFPEGQGGPKAFAKDGTAAEKTKELLVNAKAAITKLWKQRGG